MKKHSDDDGFQSTEEAYACGQMDAANIQARMANGGDNLYLSPEEALADLEQVQDNQIMQSYYKGYLLRWD